MICEPMDALHQFPVRKSKKQKQAFRQAAAAYAAELGYEVREEQGSLGSRNLVMGDPDRAQYLVTAHYDTCARLPVPNLITPCNVWTFLAYQFLVAFLMIAPGLALGILAGRATGSRFVFLGVFYFLLLGTFYLMLFGPANRHNANDNTSGVVTVLTMMRDLPPDQRQRVCFVLFDLEEAGLLGSKSHANAHKTAVKGQTVLNLDCVGDGDELLLFPQRKFKMDAARMDRLRRINGVYGRKRITLRERGFSVYPSDQANFPYGVAIAAFHSSRFGPYCSRIHTPKDTVLEEENVRLLSQTLLTYVDDEATG